MWWDDGVESNAYVGGIGTTLGTNVKFTGQATISPGWSAGYVLHIEADGTDSLAGTNQDNARRSRASSPARTNYVQTLQSFWFVKSEQLGKVGVGLQSRPRTTRPSWLTARARSFPPTGWRSTSVASAIRTTRRRAQRHVDHRTRRLQRRR